MIESIKRQLDPVSQEFFKLSIDGIVDTAQTAHRFAFSGNLRRQTCGTIGADRGLTLQQFDLSAGIFDPLNLVRSGRALISSGENCVQVAEAAPLAQMFF